MQSMVWCNQLVVLLAGLLQSITQPYILGLHAQQGAQPLIIHHMQAATQPRLATFLGLSPPAVHNITTLLRNRDGQCQGRAVGAGSVVTKGPMLQVIRLSSGAGCLSE